MHGFETVENRTYLDRAVKVYTGYRFVVCVENTRASGYITEKIVSAFLAGAIPIYIGAPDVAAHFDQQAFVNCNEKTLKECASEVQRIDANESLFQAMRHHPPLHANRLNAAFSWHPSVRVPSEKVRAFTVAVALKRHFASMRPSYTCAPEAFKVASLGMPPDVSLLLRPQTASVLTPFLEATEACPLVVFPPISERFDVTCQVTNPRRLQGFVGCEVGNVSYAKGREVASLEIASANDQRCAAKIRSESSQKSWLLVPDGDECHFAGALDESLSAGRIAGLVVMRNADIADTTKHAALGSLPWVYISNVDASWLHHEVAKGENIKFEVAFKPRLNSTIDALLVAARPAGDSKELICSCAACVQQALALGPLFKRVSIAAARICGKLANNSWARAFELRASRLSL